MNWWQYILTCGGIRCKSCYCSYTPPIRKYLKETIYASIPISIAAALSQFIQSIITYITVKNRSSHGNNSINLQIGQTLVYCLIMFSGGKYFTYLIQQCVLQKKEDNSWFNFFHKNQYIPLILNLLAENAGFAWRQFAVLIVLSYFYQNYDVGAASSYKNYHEVLSDFDSDALALSVAYVATVLLAIFMNEIFGSNFVDEEGYLFEWQSKSSGHASHGSSSTDDGTSPPATDDGAIYLASETSSQYYNYYSYYYSTDDSQEDNSFNGFYFVYCIVVTLLIAVVFLIEDRNGCLDTENSEDDPEKIDNQDTGGDVLNPITSSKEKNDVEAKFQNLEIEEVKHANVEVEESKKKFYSFVRNIYQDFWHTFLGCLSGVAWFTLIIDELMSYTAGDKIATLIVCAVCAALLTWRAPFFVNAITRSQLRAQGKLDTYSEKSSSKSIDNNNNVDSSKSSVLRVLIRGFSRFIYSIISYYYHLKVHHKGLLLISLRLTIGWIWEIFIINMLEYLITDGKYSKAKAIGINFAAFIIIVVISIIAHRLVRDLDDLEANSEGIEDDAKKEVRHPESRGEDKIESI
eukprot:gene11400-12429_t